MAAAAPGRPMLFAASRILANLAESSSSAAIFHAFMSTPRAGREKRTMRPRTQARVQTLLHLNAMRSAGRIGSRRSERRMGMGPAAGVIESDAGWMIGVSAELDRCKPRVGLHALQYR